MPSSACHADPRPLHSFPTRRSSDLVEDAGFVKLRELSVRYRLSGRLLGTLASARISGASISLIGRNLLTFTNYKGYDPEVGVGNTIDRKSTRLNSSHSQISYAVFCLPRRPPPTPLFPYTTLFRSRGRRRLREAA